MDIALWWAKSAAAASGESSAGTAGGVEGGEVLRQNAVAFLSHVALVTHQAAAEGREPRPAAFLAAGAGGDDALLEQAVQLIRQQPGAAVGHFHGAAGGGDRAGLADQFQQADLAGTHGAGRRQIDADGELGHCGCRAVAYVLPPAAAGRLDGNGSMRTASLAIRRC